MHLSRVTPFDLQAVDRPLSERARTREPTGGLARAARAPRRRARSIAVAGALLVTVGLVATFVRSSRRAPRRRRRPHVATVSW